MHREPTGVGPDLGEEYANNSRTSDALHVLLEARERLLAQMTEDVLTHQEALLDASGEESAFSFELQEIEDRYSARLSALNALVENLEFRQPRVRHRVETLSTTVDSVAERLTDLLARLDDWDLVDFEVVPRGGDRLLLIVALARDDYE
jgi:response regulator RpfG family c-di-GMP phosphodiesterase